MIMTSKQQVIIKSSIVDANNYLNGIFLSFNSLNREFYLGNRLVDFFSDCFSIHKADCNLEESKSHYCSHLDNVILTASSNLSIIIVVSDTSIKNNVATSIAHVYSFNNPLRKILHHTINITTMKVELFAIRYGINQATQIPDISCIVIITDVLHVAKKIFNSTIHLYQI